MKVLFIDSYWNNGHDPMHLGLAYIMSSIDDNAITEIKLVDFVNYNSIFSNSVEEFEKDENKFFKEVKEESVNSDIIMITCSYGYYPRALKAAEIAKEANGDSLVIMGGSFISYLDKWQAARCQPLLDSTCVDILCVGEGENVVSDLVKLKKGKIKYSDIPGIKYRAEFNEIKINAPRVFEKDLNVIKYPEWSYFNRAKYPEFFPIIGSRGCPHYCNFCFEREHWRKQYRCRTAQNIMGEIERNLEKFNVRNFSMEDSSFIAYPYAKELCLELINRKEKYTWWALARVDEICANPGLVELMAKAGCVSLIVGFESPNPDELKGFDKGITTKQHLEAINIMRSCDIHIQGCFILAFPEKPLYNIEHTVNYGLNLGVDVKRWHFFQPVYSKLHENIQVRKEYGPWQLKDSLVNVPDTVLAQYLKRGYLYQLTDEHALIRMVPYSDTFEELGNVVYDGVSVDRLYSKIRSELILTNKSFDESEYYSVLS